MKENIFSGAANMLTVVVVAMVIVLVAMMLDLASGLNKAKQRGELRSSEALKRTLNKFIAYEGGMIIAAGVDVLMHMSHLVHLFGLEAIYGVPVVTCLIGVFLLVVEFISIREKADAKTKKQMNDAAKLLNDMLQNENLKEVFRVAMEQQEKAKEKEEV
ncbi:MAG: phage holin family protein [Bacteroidales bacterium]|nr:phage holin family protein [Bacteroidales bacterium]